MFFGSSKPVIGKASLVIDLARDQVFDFVGHSFFVNYPRWSPEVVKFELIEGETMAVGTLMRQVRIDHGHKSESTFEVSEFDPPRKISFAGVSNAYRCIYEFEEDGTESRATKLTFTFEFPELELMLRPFEKLVRVAVQDGANRTARNLHGLIESQSGRRK
jgi:hypothetical protein